MPNNNTMSHSSSNNNNSNNNCGGSRSSSGSSINDNNDLIIRNTATAPAPATTTTTATTGEENLNLNSTLLHDVQEGNQQKGNNDDGEKDINANSNNIDIGDDGECSSCDSDALLPMHAIISSPSHHQRRRQQQQQHQAANVAAAAAGGGGGLRISTPPGSGNHLLKTEGEACSPLLRYLQTDEQQQHTLPDLMPTSIAKPPTITNEDHQISFNDEGIIAASAAAAAAAPVSVVGDTNDEEENFGGNVFIQTGDDSSSSIPPSPAVMMSNQATRPATTRSASPPATSSAPSSSHSNSSRETTTTSGRRRRRHHLFGRSITPRATTTRSKKRTVPPISTSSPRQFSPAPPPPPPTATQSLGDEDLFAMVINGEDPRLPTTTTTTNTTGNSTGRNNTSTNNSSNSNNNSSNNNNSTPPRTSWEAPRIHPSEQFPPIVWEEISDSELERGGGQQPRQRRRRRTLSEPNGNRIRDIFFPRRISFMGVGNGGRGAGGGGGGGGTPALQLRQGVVRQRGSGRQSRSVRSALPQRSSGSAAAAAPLSSTAAAALFTSSQASVASSNNNNNNNSHDIGGVDVASQISRRHHQQQQQVYNHRHSGGGGGGGSQPSRVASSSSDNTHDDSGMAVGPSFDHQSITVDSAGGDAMSVSTIGNSTLARSDILSIVPNDNGMRLSANAADIGEVGRHNHHGHQQHRRQLPFRQTSRRRAGRDGGGEGADDDDPSREARVRWVRINQRFQLMITFVAILFSMLLFSILISWIVLTSAYVVTFDRACDIPLKPFYWLVTLQLILDVFRNDIMRHILQWDPSAQPVGSHHTIPARVVAYNIAYMAYAVLVLRLGINSVYIDGRQPDSFCRATSPELFQSSTVFVTLTLVCWATIILGYLVPFCFVAVLLTWNGYNPNDSINEPRVTAGQIPGSVFGQNGAPPGCIEQLREIGFDDCDENCPQECCICMEEFHSESILVQTDCGHILHKNCCSVWLRQARTCPVCRTDIPDAQEERLRQDQQQQGGNVSISQQELGHSMQVGERQPNPDAHRPRVHINQPAGGLPFRPAGRHEVETLIRAFRRPRRNERNGARGNGRTRRSSSQRLSQGHSARRNGREGTMGGSNRSHGDLSQDRRQTETTATIEIPMMTSHREASSSVMNTSSSSVHGDDQEAQFVL